MAASESALPASVPPMPPHIAVLKILASLNRLGNILGKAVRRAGHAAANRLSENEEVGIKVFDLSVATGSRTNRVGFVNDEQSSVLARELAQPAMVAGIGMHDPYIGHCRLGQDAGDIARL